MQTQLTIQPLKNILDGKTLSEYINDDVLQRLISSSLPKPVMNKFTMQFYDNEKKQLEALHTKTKNGLAQIKYKRQSRKYGRVNPENGIGLSMLSKRIRHTLCKDVYEDIDIINCHPIILYQVCQYNNIDCPNLSIYITDRNTKLREVMAQYDVSRDEAKKIIYTFTIFWKL